MYDNVRMFYENLLSEDVMTSGDFDDGIFSGVIKNGAGSATMQVQGSFTGIHDLLYTVEIFNVSSGPSPKEIGYASFRVRTQDTALGEWISAGATTTSASWITLTNCNGLQIKWTAGSENDFELNDTFYVIGKASYSPRHVWDQHRDIYCRSLIPAFDPTPLTWQFHIPTIAAGTPLVFCLPDYGYLVETGGSLDNITHDLPSVFRLRVGTDSDIDDATYNLTWAPGTAAVQYLDGLNPALAYTYFALDFSHPHFHSADFYIWLGEMFLGDYVEFPAGAMYNWGSSERLVSEMADNALFDYPRRILANRRELTLKWQNVHTDYRSYFDNLYAATRQASDGMEHPVFVHLDPTDDGESLYWMKLVNDLDREWTQYQHDSLTLQFREVTANYAL